MKLGLGVVVFSILYLPLNAEDAGLSSMNLEKWSRELSRLWLDRKNSLTPSTDQVRSELSKICTTVLINMVEGREELDGQIQFMEEDPHDIHKMRAANVLIKQRLIRELADAAETWNHLNCQAVLRLQHL